MRTCHVSFGSAVIIIKVPQRHSKTSVTFPLIKIIHAAHVQLQGFIRGSEYEYVKNILGYDSSMDMSDIWVVQGFYVSAVGETHAVLFSLKCFLKPFTVS